MCLVSSYMFRCLPNACTEVTLSKRWWAPCLRLIATNIIQYHIINNQSLMGTPNYGNCLFPPCPMLKCWFIFTSNSWGIPGLPRWPVKNPPAIWETRVQSMGWEDILEKGTATHSSILALRVPWTVESMGSQRVGHNWVTFTFTFKFMKTLTP